MMDDSTSTQPSIDPQEQSLLPSPSPENEKREAYKSTLENDPPTTDPLPHQKQQQRSSCRWLQQLLLQPITIMLVFYMVGTVWHAMHPLVSVFTGQTKPRRLYIDENSLEISYFRPIPSYPSASTRQGQRQHHRRPVTSLCLALQQQSHHHHHHSTDPPPPLAISCHSQKDEEDGLFDVAQILPSSGGSNAIEPHNEALVLVVPATSDWNTSPFHLAILHLTHRLSRQAPWLAKKIFLVAPVFHHNRTTTTLSLHDTVDLFLDAYLGSRSRDRQQLPRSGYMFVSNPSQPPFQKLQQQQQRLPFSFRGAILRQLIVLDNLIAKDEPQPPTTAATLDAFTAAAAEIRILPGGRSGVLPNMDLTSMVRLGMGQRVRSLSSSSSVLLPPRIVMHSHTETSQRWKLWLYSFLSKPISGSDSSFDKWLDAFLDMILFEYSLISANNGGNLPPPHSEALDRGIDSLTIQTAHCADPTPVVETMEVIIRSLSNLHERLHHSTALYLITSSEHFVKHEEYLVPNLLVIIPLLVRVLTLLFVQFPKSADDSGGFDWHAVQTAICFVALTVVWIAYGLAMVEYWFGVSSSALGNDKSNRVMMRAPAAAWSHAVVALPYLVLILRFISTQVALPSTTKTITTITTTTTTEDQTLSQVMTISRRQHQSLQFVACLLAIYIHIPIAFGHVSLAFPSALFWSPLLAFGNASSAASCATTTGRVRLFLRGMFRFLLLSATCPCFIALVGNEPLHIFSSYTPYVKYACLPLHLLASMTWLCPL